MKKIKEIAQGVASVLLIQYFLLRYSIAVNGIIHLLAKMNKLTGKETEFDYVWGERYCNWIEYLRRRSCGIKCTYEEVEFEFLKDFSDKVDEASRKFHEERDKDHNWFWL
jgi:hypothetical protein